MATIINNPPQRAERVDHVVDDNTSSGVGFVIGMILLVLAVILLFAYGIPALRRAGSNSTGTGNTYNITVPGTNGGSGSSTGSGSSSGQ